MTEELSRGQTVIICIPTEGLPDEYFPALGVLVLDGDVHIKEWKLNHGHTVRVQVGKDIKAYIERIGPDQSNLGYIIAAKQNKRNVRVSWEHALDGPQHEWLKPGQLVEINLVVARRWEIRATEW